MKKILLTLILAGSGAALAQNASPFDAIDAVVLHYGGGYGFGLAAEFGTVNNLVGEVGIGTGALVVGAKYFTAPRREALYFAGRVNVGFGYYSGIGAVALAGYRFLPAENFLLDVEGGFGTNTGLTIGVAGGYRF